jgi:hypothetical protein
VLCVSFNKAYYTMYTLSKNDTMNIKESAKTV